MMPVSDIDMRDPDNGLAQQITASPEAPVPRIMIFGVDGNEATTVRIGDKLTFKIEIPGNSKLTKYYNTGHVKAKKSTKSKS